MIDDATLRRMVKSAGPNAPSDDPVLLSPMRRMAYFEVTYQMIVNMASSHGPVTSSLPFGAVALHVVPDDIKGVLRVFIEADWLDAVPEGAAIPRIEPYLDVGREVPANLLIP